MVNISANDLAAKENCIHCYKNSQHETFIYLIQLQIQVYGSSSPQLARGIALWIFVVPNGKTYYAKQGQ